MNDKQLQWFRILGTASQSFLWVQGKKQNLPFTISHKKPGTKIATHTIVISSSEIYRATWSSLSITYRKNVNAAAQVTQCRFSIIRNNIYRNLSDVSKKSKVIICNIEFFLRAGDVVIFLKGRSIISLFKLMTYLPSRRKISSNYTVIISNLKCDIILTEL